VTPTGQVATSYPDAATVFSLNLERAKGKIPQFVKPQTLEQVQTDVRMVTRAETAPGGPPPEADSFPEHFDGARYAVTNGTWLSDGVRIDTSYREPRRSAGKHGAVLVLSDAPSTATSKFPDSDLSILAITPRPSPPGGEETKSPILGPFYMTELRAELVGKTILGMRVDDVIRAVDYLASRGDVDPHDITVVASGHMGLVALHAAVLDSRIKHVTVDHVLESYDSLLKAPMPLDAPQDILPGVLLKYDIPDLVRVLGRRVTVSDPLPGTANLAGPWKP